MILPEPEGPVIMRTEKVYVPVEEHPEVSTTVNFNGKHFLNIFILHSTVQLCGSNPWTKRNDSKAARAGNRLQDYGSRQGFDERQEEGE